MLTVLTGQPGLHNLSATHQVGLVPTDPAALTASLTVVLTPIKFMSAGLLPDDFHPACGRTSIAPRGACASRCAGALPRR
jgi:hypothetical protein